MEIQTNIKTFSGSEIDWHKYNLAKTKEKRLFYELLYELCQIIPEPLHENGRPPICVSDLVFCVGLKIYSNYSGRKVCSDLINAQKAGYITKAPHFNTLNDFFNCSLTHELLQWLLVVSALPLKNLEDSFSLDSSGWGSYQYERWKRFRFSKNFNSRGTRNYLKGHISIGTRTNVICACEITHGNFSDIKQAPKLIKTTCENFNAKEISADKAYSSVRILQLIKTLGAMPYIPFKKNANPKKDSPEIWMRMYRYFKANKELFLKHYHKRSNVETTFGMVKKKFGEFLKCKKFESQRNELLMKFIVHNICCLVSEIFENDIHVDFREAIKVCIKPK